MMKKLVYLLTIIICTAVISCVKDGDIGPQGEKGEQGDAGKDGTTVLNGNDDPTPEEGNIGDFYINTNSYVLFGPKTDSGWDNEQSILGKRGDRGAQGEKGEADYVILSGSSDPDPGIGEAGDFYYNTNAKTLFYRANGEWELTARLANTIQFTKTGVNLGASPTTIIRFNLPFDVFEKSMVHVYALNRSTVTSWHPLPGYMDADNSFRLAYEGGARTTALSIYRRTGAAVFPNSIIRIVATEADRFETVAKAVDFNDYDAVSRYFDED